MTFFRRQFFDVVILSRTIHQIWHLDKVLPSIFRVGRRVIVLFMNYGYYRNRVQFFFQGVAPKSASLPYEWYDTSNIRLLTVRDFEYYCQQNHLYIVHRFLYKHAWKKSVTVLPNLFAECALYVLEQRPIQGDR